MAKNLVIVESPAKAKTIEGYLGKDFVVKSSFGHVRDLASKGIAIDVDNNFKPDYQVSEDKKKVVAELRKLAKAADTVWLATDEDREGEAISWHLYETLKLTEKNTRRITFNEITKSAVLGAIETPRDINIDLVDAQQARRILDRLVGFELSPVLWKKIKPSLSAGRVQSVAVRLIVEKERDVRVFNSESSYKVTGQFVQKDGKTFRADLSKSFSTKKEAEKLLEKCKDTKFTVESLVKRPGKKSPAPPFTTSTLQQEASRKLGYSVSRTMQVAQGLYESGKITYMRTDSVNLSDTALAAAKAEIIESYGGDFANPKKYKTKDKGAQEAHEAIRPANFAEHKIKSGDGVALYQLIWKRAIASQMADAELERTTIRINIDGASEQFVAKGEVLTFEGFLKVYLEGKDEEDDAEEAGLLPVVGEGEVLTRKNLIAAHKFSRPPARFTEASLVKRMEELGIGRPSTYAPTISTIQNRGYVEKGDKEGIERVAIDLHLKGGSISEVERTEMAGSDKKKLIPTDIGEVVTDFLVEHFGKVLNYNFTAQVEKEFDDIAKGLIQWTKMIGEFYKPFHANVNDTLENADRASGERILGKHPESGKDVLVRIGKFGPMVQIGNAEDEEKVYASLNPGQNIIELTFEQAMDLFKLPKTLGDYESQEVIVANGRFGPYVKFDGAYVSLPKGQDPLETTLEEAVELIEAKRLADAPVAHYEDLPVQKGVGRFGPYLKWNSMFINVNKKYDFDNLTNDEIIELIEAKKQKEIDKVIHNWEEEGIIVEKARWGRSVIKKGKLKIELPKTVDAAAMSFEEVQKLVEEKTPKKKPRKTVKKAAKKPAKKTVKKK